MQSGVTLWSTARVVTMPELAAQVVRGTDWIRFEEDDGDAWIAAGPESTTDLEEAR